MTGRDPVVELARLEALVGKPDHDEHFHALKTLLEILTGELSDEGFASRCAALPPLPAEATK